MAFQSVPETAQAFVEFVQNDQVVGNTFYFRKTGGYAEANLEELADDIDDWVATEYLPNMSNEISYVRTVVRGLEDESDYEVENRDGVGIGDQAGSLLPGNVTLAFQRISGLTGRSNRGRIYVPGLRLANLTANENIASVGTLTAFLEALIEIATYAVTHGWVEVIVSRFHNGAKRETATTQNVIDWTYTNAYLDSQRGRLGN